MSSDFSPIPTYETKTLFNTLLLITDFARIMPKRKLPLDLANSAADDFHLNVVFSLKHLANVRFATASCSSTESRKFFKYRSYESWDISRKIEDFAKERMCSVFVANFCKVKLSCYLKTVANELAQWMKYQNENIFQFFTGEKTLSKEYYLIDHVVWTIRGTVDCEKTARQFLKDESLTVKERFITACIYCFQDIICEIGPSVVDKEFLIKLKELPWIRCTLVLYWSKGLYDIMSGGSFGHREIAYVHPTLLNTGVIRFISELNLFSYEELKYDAYQTVTKWTTCPYAEVLYALHWRYPVHAANISMCSLLKSFISSFLWEDYFLPTVLAYRGRLWKAAYQVALNALTDRICYSEDDSMYYKYVNIFQEIWPRMPYDLMEFVLREDRHFLPNLFLALRWDKHFNIVESLIADRSLSHKKKMLFSSLGWHLSKRVIQRTQFYYLKNFLELSQLTKQEMVEFKKQLLLKIDSSIIIRYFKKKDIAQLEEFVRWMFKGKRDVGKFKKHVFPALLKTMVRYVVFGETKTPRNVFEIEALEGFLMWHFDYDIEKVFAYKITLVENMVDKVIDTEVMRVAPVAVRKLMEWVFQRNQHEKKRLQKKWRRRRIYEFL